MQAGEDPSDVWMTFYTHPSDWINDASTGCKEFFPYTYDRVAGLAMDGEIPLWVHQKNCSPGNEIQTDLTGQRYLLPGQFARKVRNYFETHFSQESKGEHNCHHFTASVRRENPPVFVEKKFSPRSRYTDFLVECGVPVFDSLPAGVCGVLGKFTPKLEESVLKRGEFRPTFVRYGIHSVFGLGRGNPLLQVMALGGNMGLGHFPRTFENTAQADAHIRGPLRMYVNPYLVAPERPPSEKDIRSRSLLDRVITRVAEAVVKSEIQSRQRR